MGFALTRQEVLDGHVEWDVKRPFRIAQRANGLCVHHDEESGGCSIAEHKPSFCKDYRCDNDKRVWRNFEEKAPSDAIRRISPVVQ